MIPTAHGGAGLDDSFPSTSSAPASDVVVPAAVGDSVSPPSDRVYFVPYRWLQDALDSFMGEEEGKQCAIYTASSPSFPSPMKFINLINSEITLNLKPEGYIPPSNALDAVSLGRDYALVSDDMWLQTFKWHEDSNAATKVAGIAEVYPLQIRLSVMRDSNQIAIKICKRDNGNELYKRACKIFNVAFGPMHIWDYSGQTNVIILNERNKIVEESQRQSDQEVLLELQVYGLSDSVKCRSEEKNNDAASNQSIKLHSMSNGSIWGNGSIGNDKCNIFIAGDEGRLGLRGLVNIGNTCFLNSAIQCLAHTPELAKYFLGYFNEEINEQNPLGMRGELALAFGDLLRKLWAPGIASVPPRAFRDKLVGFAPQFGGFNQHDSQEFLAFLLDGVHEDLNRVKFKPYTVPKDSEGRPDEEVADEYWANHLARNNSIIVDVCQGQYRSTLVCPTCERVSITFDPFMYLSLPLPSSKVRTMTVSLFGSSTASVTTPLIVKVPKNGNCSDFIQAVSIACSLRSDEELVIAEVYSNKIIRYLEDPLDSLSLIRDADKLVAYRLQKDLEDSKSIVFTHQHEESYGNFVTRSWKFFGFPFVTRISGAHNGSNIRQAFIHLISPFLRPQSGAMKDFHEIVGSSLTKDVDDVNMERCAVEEVVLPVDAAFEFCLTDNDLSNILPITNDESISINDLKKPIHVLVRWSDRAIEHYDLRLRSPLPEVSNRGYSLCRPPEETVSLYSCLEAFLKEEPLGPEDMWYCPSCKESRQACKKLDLWRLPDVLVIHLKRFSYTLTSNHKLETNVDFPIRSFDLSDYIATNNDKSSKKYELYAMSNHNGSLGSGHYTAFIKHIGDNRWYNFDDRNVSSIEEEKIKSANAYLLFYRRIKD